jgi:hypothetical protein
MQAKTFLRGFTLSTFLLSISVFSAELDTNSVQKADFDQDGLPDSLEIRFNLDPALADTDGDGVLDAEEFGANLAKAVDTDQDGMIDALDWDDDNDQIPTALESKNDKDQDGFADYLDVDSDSDGKSDTAEAGLAAKDSDQDGLDDAFDVDATHGIDQNGDDVDDNSVLAVELTTFSQEIALAPTIEQPVISTKPSQTPSQELDANKEVLAVEVSETAGLSMVIKSDAEFEASIPSLTKKPDTDGDRLPDELEMGLDPQHPVDTDKDGIFDFLDEDDDGDHVSTLVEGEADRDGDGRVNYLDTDEGGYFYCANSGRIVSGIKGFKISPSADVILELDAKAGRYRWRPTKAGTYTLQFILPKGLHTVTELEKGKLYVTSANSAVMNLGWSENINQEAQLAGFNTQQLPFWYSSFVILEGAPPLINHNIPLLGGECSSPQS